MCSAEADDAADDVPEHMLGGALCQKSVNSETGEDCACGPACHVCRLDSQNRDAGCAICRYQRYEYGGSCRKVCPPGTTAEGSGGFDRRCITAA